MTPLQPLTSIILLLASFFPSRFPKESVLCWKMLQWAGLSGIYRAAQQGHKEGLLVLLDAGCEINASDWCGKTPLMCAACEGHAECLQLLIQRGADVKKRADGGLTAARFAAHRGHKEALRNRLRLNFCDLQLTRFWVWGNDPSKLLFFSTKKWTQQKLNS